MQCRLEVRIENRSSADATIEWISVAVLGPNGAPGVEAAAFDSFAIAPREDEVDANFDFEPARTISAGSAGSFAIVVELRPDGCTPEGSWVDFPEQPIVAVSVLRRTHERSPTGTGFGFRGSDVTDCSQ